MITLRGKQFSMTGNGSLEIKAATADGRQISIRQGPVIDHGDDRFVLADTSLVIDNQDIDVEVSR